MTSGVAFGIIPAVKHLALARYVTRLSLLALTLLLVACGGGDVPIPVINPPVTPQLGQVPGQLTPTPDLTPAESLVAAQRLLHNGDYEAALQAFHNLTIESGIPPEVVADAEFGVGQAALRQGAFSAAQAAFDNFLAANATHPQAATATFLRGEAKLGVSDWQGAIADFQAYLNLRPGLADSYVYERIGDAYVALGQTGEAIAAYEQATAAGRNISSLVELRERIAQIHLNTGNPQGAVAEYEAILNVAQIPFYRARIEFLLAQAYFAAGDDVAGNQHLHTLVNTYPDTADAYNALEALDASGASSDLDPFQRGLVEFNAEDYVAASESFYNWLALADPQHPADAHFYLARSWNRLGNPDAALTEYQTVIDTHEGDLLWGQAFLEYAEVQAQVGNVDGAIGTLEAFIDDNPDAREVPDALYQAGQLMESLGDTERAADYYARLAERNPADERAAQGLLRVGMRYYQNNDLDSAERTFTSALAHAQDHQLAAVNLWLGRIYQAQGRADEAASAFTSAAAADPGGYYALRAGDLQTSRTAFQSPEDFSFDFDEAGQQAQAETWLVNTFALQSTPPLSDLRADLATDARMIRGQELWALGLREEAKLELESLRHDYAGDPLALYQLALFFRDIGLYRSSVSAAFSLIGLSGQTTLEVPPFIARLAFPVYYSDLVLPAAEQYGLDPLFVFALIRQESLFEGFVTSFAFAQGLMQIVPGTGEEIAAQLGWPDYQNEDLYRPYVNVEFGTYYLAQQRNIFDGDLFAGMAAYNAGAGNVLEWWNQSNMDVDLFVEVIPFDETYDYVTLTYAQYDIYRELYGLGG